MKGILIDILLVAILLSASGCATANQKHAGTFLAFCATHNFTAANVSQTTKSPWFTHTESLSGLTKKDDQTTVNDLSASLTIWAAGLPVASWEFKADAIQISSADLPALAKAAAP